MSEQTRPVAGDTQDIDRRILEAIRSIRYGSVEIIIHDSAVVQIERKEKVRFDVRERQRERPRKG